LSSSLAQFLHGGIQSAVEVDVDVGGPQRIAEFVAGDDALPVL